MRGAADADHTTKSDVGNFEGTAWSLSSAKPQHGVAQLMDDSLETLWQYVAQLTQERRRAAPHRPHPLSEAHGGDGTYLG